MEFEISILINRPVESVFEYVTDDRNGYKWNSVVKDVKKFSEGPIGVNTEYWMQRELLNGQAENTYEITEYKPDKQLTIITKTGPTLFTYHYYFESAGSCTKLALKAEDFEIGRKNRQSMLFTLNT